MSNGQNEKVHAKIEKRGHKRRVLYIATLCILRVLFRRAQFEFVDIAY